MKKLTLALAPSGAALRSDPPGARAHGNDNTLIASSGAGSGSLKLLYKDEANYVDAGPNLAGVTRVGFDTPLGGFSVYSGIEPAIELLRADDVANAAYVLTGGTDVSVEITAIDSVVSVSINSTLLDSVGDSAALGTESPTFDHIHPQFFLTGGQALDTYFPCLAPTVSE